MSATATARQLTTTAKAAASAATQAVRFTTTSQGPYSFRIVLTGTEAASYSDQLRAAGLATHAIQGADGGGRFTATWGRDQRTQKLIINVVDEQVREASVQEMGQAREDALTEALAEIPTEEEVPETGGVIRQEEHGARYFTAEERARAAELTAMHDGLVAQQAAQHTAEHATQAPTFLRHPHRATTHVAAQTRPGRTICGQQTRHMVEVTPAEARDLFRECQPCATGSFLTAVERTETVEHWGPDAVVVTREYDAPAEAATTFPCIQHINRGPECGPDCDEMTARWNAVTTLEEARTVAATARVAAPAWMGEVAAMGEALRVEGVLPPARHVAEDNALADVLLPYRLEQSDRNAWQVLDRQTGALWGTVHRREESMRPGMVQWTRWVAYRPDGSHAHYTDSLPGAAQLLVPLTAQAQATLAERAEEPAKRPCWHVTTWGGETYGVAAYTADDAQALVNLRIRTEDANDWPVAATQVGLWEAEPGTVLHY